ncbi:MAG: GNAT family N-acetyltransferase, partial [Clostridiales bacterium]|nr:GNAT family N-acetyltransferase [Clostridiales bacterium]
EIKAFALAKGFSSILCDEYLKIDGIGFSSGAVMKSDKKAEMDSDFAVIDEYPHLLDLYNFIDYDEKGFDSWYVDISHRIRHNSALAASLNIGGEIISSAVLSSIYNNDAVITAVRTNIKFRNRGYASALVSSLCCCVKGTVYLMREENRNEKFYKKLGFENCGIWRMYK